MVVIIAEAAHEFDQKWQKRKRLIDSLLLVFIIFRLLYSKNKQGYGTTISDFWNNCNKINFPLPQEKPISASAFAEARTKLDANLFKILNQRIIKTYEEETKDLFKLKSHRIFAVDGSKINLPRTLIENGYKTPSDQSHYPQGLVSCLYQLKSKIPYDFDIVSHGDERKCALSHLRILKKNDIVVYDRGYFSYAMLFHHIKLGIVPVFRLPNNSFHQIEKFRVSGQVDQVINLLPTKDTRRDIKKKYPEIEITPLKFRLIKYTIGENTYCLGTTLFDLSYDRELFKNIYHSRWGIEELYKISKTFIEVDDFHGKSERGVQQELYAHFVMITMNRLCSNEAEYQIDKIMNTQNHNEKNKPKTKVNFKNCLATISRHLEEIMLIPVKSVNNVLKNIIGSISRYRNKTRKNRSYLRKSMKPIKKWNKKKANIIVPIAVK